MMGRVSQPAPLSDHEQGGPKHCPEGEMEAALRAQASRAQHWVFGVMVFLIVLPVVAWWHWFL
jgi:hypothetical protein